MFLLLVNSSLLWEGSINIYYVRFAYYSLDQFFPLYFVGISVTIYPIKPLSFVLLFS